MLNKYLKVDYTEKIREELILPTYLSDLYEKDPVLTKRVSHNYPLKDANNLKKLIVPGTIAETMLNAMCRFNETKSGKAEIKRFYGFVDDFKNSSIKQKSAKAIMKSSMMQEIAHEEDERGQKKLKTSVATSSNDRSVMSGSAVEEDRIKSKKKIWQEWKEFLNNAQNNNYLPSLSPEKHGTSRNHMLESIEDLRSAEGNVVEKKTLIDFFMLFGEEIYDDIGDTLSESEACLNSNLIKPCLQACSRMLRNKKYDITYVPGEVELTSMTEQLSKQGLLDNRFKYYADGKVRINADKQEPLLLEVSSALGRATRDKIAFDHTKAMFGLLAILKTLACKYSHGSFESFKKIKIHFIHVHGHAIRHWTMMTPEPGVYIMTKEQKATIPVNINSMADDLASYVRFHLNLTGLLRETLDSIEELRKKHRSQLEVMISNEQISAETLLSSIINPVIIRLNEGKHAKEVVGSPQSGSNSPQH
ncbi:hypothetical protein G6F43_002267 [Rhizopus delemar]|nr:hypothetical protein G6F43_002267 [Rhizopus delemar]